MELLNGENLYPDIDVNAKMLKQDRRVPIKNMIYIADGPSDIPAFSVVKMNKGKTFAIYPKRDKRAFEQVNELISDGRIDMFAEADYSEGTTIYIWLTTQVKSIAERIYLTHLDSIANSFSKVPEHIM